MQGIVLEATFVNHLSLSFSVLTLNSEATYLRMRYALVLLLLLSEYNSRLWIKTCDSDAAILSPFSDLQVLKLIQHAPDYPEYSCQNVCNSSMRSLSVEMVQRLEGLKNLRVLVSVTLCHLCDINWKVSPKWEVQGKSLQFKSDIITTLFEVQAILLHITGR